MISYPQALVHNVSCAVKRALSPVLLLVKVFTKLLEYSDIILKVFLVPAVTQRLLTINSNYLKARTMSHPTDQATDVGGCGDVGSESRCLLITCMDTVNRPLPRSEKSCSDVPLAKILDCSLPTVPSP
jgi:hypothetical protein